MKNLVAVFLIAFAKLAAGDQGCRPNWGASAISFPEYYYYNPYQYYQYQEYQGSWRRYYAAAQPHWVYSNGCYWFIEADGSASLGYCY